MYFFQAWTGHFEIYPNVTGKFGKCPRKKMVKFRNFEKLNKGLGTKLILFTRESECQSICWFNIGLKRQKTVQLKIFWNFYNIKSVACCDFYWVYFPLS